MPVAAVKSATLNVALISGLRTTSAWASDLTAKPAMTSQGAGTKPQLASTAASPQPMDSRSPRCQKGSRSSSLRATSKHGDAEAPSDGGSSAIEERNGRGLPRPSTTVHPTHEQVRRRRSTLSVIAHRRLHPDLVVDSHSLKTYCSTASTTTRSSASANNRSTHRGIAGQFSPRKCDACRISFRSWTGEGSEQHVPAARAHRDPAQLSRALRTAAGDHSQDQWLT